MLNKVGKNNKFQGRTIALSILLVGVLIRVTVYLQNRSLFLDEANLARNIVERGYNDFFENLDYEQYAPPLYLIITKLSTDLFGINEFALRLPSLIAGISSLILFFRLLNFLLKSDISKWYIFLLFAFSILLIRYSSEVKQYAFDLALTLALVLWAFSAKDKKLNRGKTIKWALVGSLCIWLSMPIIFVLAAIGLAFLYEFWARKQVVLTSLLPIGLSWVCSFAIYFFLILNEDASNSNLVNYHSVYFFRIIPSDMETLNQNLEILLGIFRSTTDQTALSIVWSILIFLSGSYMLVKKDKYLSIILLTPIALCLLASSFEFYSLIERLTIFFIPILMLIMGFGLSFLWQKAHWVIKIVMVVVMFVTIVNKKGYEYFWQKFEKEDSKSVLNYLENNANEDDLIYVQADGVPAFVFYNEYYDNAYGFENIYLAKWDELPFEVIPPLIETNSGDKFWLFFSHTFPQQLIDRNLESAKNLGSQVDQFNSYEASTYLFLKN